VSRKRVYAYGRIRYHCSACDDAVGTIEAWFGREVECYRIVRPEIVAMGRRLAMAEHAIGEPDDPIEMMAWLRGLARTAASGLFPVAEMDGQNRRPG
jgi:hypothetical protein